MKTHIPLTTVAIMALLLGSGIADEFKIQFFDAAQETYVDGQKLFNGKIPIIAKAIRKDGKLR
ncbi:MAG: hypothetical protein WCL39_13580, partial [Armatimonadota bacterium]